jgi:uncharacterized protein (DUF433 family)
MEPTPTPERRETTATTSAPRLERVRIVSTPGTCGDKPRIDGHRITVKHIVLDHQRVEMSPDEIVSAYPSLTISDVYAALAYYHDHRADILPISRPTTNIGLKSNNMILAGSSTD